MKDLYDILTEELAGFGLTVSHADESYGGFFITCTSSGQFAATVGGEYTDSCGTLRGQFVISPNYDYIRQTLQGAVYDYVRQHTA